MGNYSRRLVFFIVISLVVVYSFKTQVIFQAANEVKTIPVLCYHRIIPNPTSSYDLTPEQLEAHFQYLKTNGYQPITAAQFIEYQKKPVLFPPKPVVLTFDDGTKSHYTQVLPLLKKYGFKATFYIFTNAMRGSKERWLRWDEVSEIAKAGMDIGSHTVSHPYLTSRDKMNEVEYQAWLEKELFQSKQTLEEKVGVKVKTLAYPFGLYDRQVETTAIKAGYTGLFSINMGPNDPRDNPYRLKRRLMVNSIGPKSLANILNENSLRIQILSPTDGEILNSLPVIRFKVKTPGIERVRIELYKYQTSLKPDSNGVYTFTIPETLKPGFYSVIVRGSGGDNQSYLNSWSFLYRPKK